MPDQEHDASFLERIVTQVVGLATRSEIPDPVTRSLASHLASGVEKSAAALGAHDAGSVLEAVVNMNVGGSPGQLAFARMIVDAALARRESRGGHYRADFPVAGEATRTVVTLEAAGALRRRAA